MNLVLIEINLLQEIKEFIKEELANVGKMSQLKSFEKVKDIYIYPEGFTIEANLLTPTLKNKVSL